MRCNYVGKKRTKALKNTSSDIRVQHHNIKQPSLLRDPDRGGCCWGESRPGIWNPASSSISCSPVVPPGKLKSESVLTVWAQSIKFNTIHVYRARVRWNWKKINVDKWCVIRFNILSHLTRAHCYLSGFWASSEHRYRPHLISVSFKPAFGIIHKLCGIVRSTRWQQKKWFLLDHSLGRRVARLTLVLMGGGSILSRFLKNRIY